jgi:hypothetical protein
MHPESRSMISFEKIIFCIELSNEGIMFMCMMLPLHSPFSLRFEFLLLQKSKVEWSVYMNRLFPTFSRLGWKLASFVKYLKGWEKENLGFKSQSS